MLALCGRRACHVLHCSPNTHARLFFTQVFGGGNKHLKNALAPPAAKKKPHQCNHLLKSWSDPYAWLEDDEDAGTVEYISAENKYVTVEGAAQGSVGIPKR